MLKRVPLSLLLLFVFQANESEAVVGCGSTGGEHLSQAQQQFVSKQDAMSMPSSAESASKTIQESTPVLAPVPVIGHDLIATVENLSGVSLAGAQLVVKESEIINSSFVAMLSIPATGQTLWLDVIDRDASWSPRRNPHRSGPNSGAVHARDDTANRDSAADSSPQQGPGGRDIPAREPFVRFNVSAD